MGNRATLATTLAAAAAMLGIAGPAAATTASHSRTSAAHPRVHARRHATHRKHAVKHRHTAKHRPRATTATAVPPPAPAPCIAADQPAITTATATLRAAVVCLVNQERVSRRLPALRANALLDRSAQGWSDWMVANSTFAHVVGTSTPATRATAVGYDWWAFGENIATGFATPRSVVTAWMASDGHCRNILDPQYVEVGTGINVAPVPGAASGPATWTQDFGLPAETDPPSGNTGPASGCPYNS